MVTCQESTQLENCQGCGWCCEKLIDYMSLERFGQEPVVMRFGMKLLPEETRMFPDHMILPAVGVGPQGEDGYPAIVLTYQLSVDICPHLDSVRGGCTIYDQRPVMCRAYPVPLLECIPEDKRLAHRCHVVREWSSETILPPELDKAQEALLASWDGCEELFPRWLYDLDRGWLSTQDLTGCSA